MNILDFEGKTFLYPTDTILGLGCSVFDGKSIEKIYQLKERSNDKSLILLVNSEQMLQKFVEVPAMAWEIMDISDNPVTIVYENPINLPQSVVAKDNSVAIRFTKDKFCSQIINALRAPIVSTSANISGENSPKKLDEVHEKIKQNVDFIFPECIDFQPKFKTSSIIKITKDNVVKVIRA